MYTYLSYCWKSDTSLSLVSKEMGIISTVKRRWKSPNYRCCACIVGLNESNILAILNSYNFLIATVEVGTTYNTSIMTTLHLARFAALLYAAKLAIHFARFSALYMLRDSRTTSRDLHPYICCKTRELFRKIYSLVYMLQDSRTAKK